MPKATPSLRTDTDEKSTRRNSYSQGRVLMLSNQAKKPEGAWVPWKHYPASYRSHWPAGICVVYTLEWTSVVAIYMILDTFEFLHCKIVNNKNFQWRENGPCPNSHMLDLSIFEKLEPPSKSTFSYCLDFVLIPFFYRAFACKKIS